MTNCIRMVLAAGMVGLAATGCRPAEPPPDMLKEQRAALSKARAVEGQLQRQAEEQVKAVDEAQK